MTDAPLGRLRIVYRHGEALRYISHLDLLRAFERAVRRAGLPIAHTQGFNPRPRITWAAPLPLGFTSETEMADCLLTAPVPPAEFAAGLGAQLPPALVLLSVEEIPRNAPSLPAALRQMRYRVSLPAVQDLAGAEAAVAALLAAPRWDRPRRARGRAAEPGSYDLRPRVISLAARQADTGIELEMELTSGQEDMGRPDEVLAALGYAGQPALICRLAMTFAPPAAAPEEPSPASD
jgi:radical SAM-linked protein